MRTPSPCSLALVLAGMTWMWVPAAGDSCRAAEPGMAYASPGGGPMFPNAADPNYAKTYSQYSRQVQSQPVVAPALGYQGRANAADAGAPRAEGGLAGITDSIWSPIKKGASKVGDFITPEERVQRAPEATSVYSPAKPGPETFVALARLHEEAGRLPEAEQQYQSALAANPKHLGALLGYAHLMDRQGQAAEAIQLYQRTAAAHPNEASVFNDMGLCYARNGHFNSAADHLGHAVQIQPKKALYRNNLAIVLVETGQHDQALAHLGAVYPEAVARFNLGQLLLRKGDAQGAADQFALAQRADPTMVQAKAWLVELARNGVTPHSESDRVAAWNRAEARRSAANQAASPPANPAAPDGTDSRARVPTTQPPRDYGNFPVPSGRQTRPGLGPQAEGTAPRQDPGPAPAQGRWKAVAPEPAARGETWQPTVVGPPAGPAAPREAGTVPGLAPAPADEAVAPLPPVGRPGPSVEPLPPVEDPPPP